MDDAVWGVLNFFASGATVRSPHYGMSFSMISHCGHANDIHLKSGQPTQCLVQVAQLWQRDCAKLASFTIKNVQRYSQNHKIAFLRHLMEYHVQ